jgi:alpha-beta hydrolase superfamily lysophospholipase
MGLVAIQIVLKFKISPNISMLEAIMFYLSVCFRLCDFTFMIVDFQGHGYSEGERALVHSHEELLDDLVSFVDYFRYPEKNLHSIVKTTSDEITRQHLRELPFFVMGQSMGGGVIALTSNTFTSYPKYLGSVLLAPYLGVAPVPHWIVLTILKHTVISCFPNYHMPSWLDGMTDPRYRFLFFPESTLIDSLAL